MPGNDNIEYLNVIHKVDEAATGVLHGIELVIQGGPEGLKEISPEYLIETFGSIHVVVSALQTIARRSVNHELDMMDGLERLVTKVEEETSQENPGS